MLLSIYYLYQSIYLTIYLYINVFTCILATIMQSLKQLESLNLSWNKSVGEILQQLLEPVQADCKLQELRLSSCDLTTEDMLHLGTCGSKVNGMAKIHHNTFIHYNIGFFICEQNNISSRTA